MTTPAGSSAVSKAAVSLGASLASAPVSSPIIRPSVVTMKARSMLNRCFRFSIAETMVAESPVATASRKPKSRDSSEAPSRRRSDRSDQTRSNTVPAAVSSSRTCRCDAPSMAVNTAPETSSSVTPKSAT